MSEKRISRRKFLGYGGIALAGLALEACSPAATPAPTTAPAPVPTNTTAAAAPATTAPVAPTTAPTARPVSNIDWWTVQTAPEAGASAQGNAALLAEWVKTPSGKFVNVKPTFLPDDGFSEKMTTVMGSGVGVPDVSSIVSADWFPAAEDLRPYIAKDKLDISMYSKDHFDSRCRFGDKIIGLPTAIGATIYFYNTALLDAKGIKYPEWGYTMDQWLNDAVKISDRSKKIFGATIQTRIWRAEMFAFGARPFSDDGKTVEGYMNGPKTVKAFEFFYDLANSGAVPTAAEFDVLKTEGTGPIDLFNTGRLAFAPLNNGQFGIVEKAGIKYGLIHNPKAQGEEIVTNGWAIQAGIPAASKNKDAAWEYVKWWAGPDGQKFLQNQNVGFTSVIPSQWKDHPAANDKRLQFFFEILKTKMLWTWSGQFPYFAKVTRLNQDLYDGIYQGKVKRGDIKAGLDAQVKAAQQIVDDERKKLGLK
jgi:multiple sugar transport system substrate-binding protein